MSTSSRVIAVAVFASLLIAAVPAFAQRTGGQTGDQRNADGSFGTKPAPIVTEVVIPGTPTAPDGTAGTLTDLAQYIGIVYNFLIGIVGLVAAVMIVIGGFQYLTSAGDSGKIGAAKIRIINALIGVVLALGAYTILNTINPAMLKLKVPGGIKAVRTEITFLPFCDDLAKLHKITEEQITLVSTSVNSKKGCGEPGFIWSKIRNSDGSLEDSRIWCLWRGDKAFAAQLRADGKHDNLSDYGCVNDNSIGGTRILGLSDVRYDALAVCVPTDTPTQARLNELYDKKEDIPTLGRCTACNQITDGWISKHDWPRGDLACEYWQNIANNGDPKDDDFKISRKKIMQDSRKLKVGDIVVKLSDEQTIKNVLQDPTSYDRISEKRTMYYCGYSANLQKCVGLKASCELMSNCKSYDTLILPYCEGFNDEGEADCHTTLTLGSAWASQAGNAAHLLPICGADPCETGGVNGCRVDGLAGMRNSIIGGFASTLRVTFRVATAGLTNGINCVAK